MYKKSVSLICASALLLIIAGCASFRSDIKGKYEGKTEKNFGADKVSVLFIFSHYEQAKGYDAIPKLENKRQIISDFDDLFIDALTELSNVGRYNTFIVYASDIGEPERRAKKDSLINCHDYIVRMKFLKENSFAKHFLGTLVSTVSATLLPMPYTRHYSLTVDLFDGNDVLIHTYKRESSLTKWVQSLMVFIYPFHTEARKTEEIYINFMHDVFKQIESSKVLSANSAGDS